MVDLVHVERIPLKKGNFGLKFAQLSHSDPRCAFRTWDRESLGVSNVVAVSHDVDDRTFDL